MKLSGYQIKPDNFFIYNTSKKINIMQQKIRNKFQELFSTKGSVYASPGRINLIGEHNRL